MEAWKGRCWRRLPPRVARSQALVPRREQALVRLTRPLELLAPASLVELLLQEPRERRAQERPELARRAPRPAVRSHQVQARAVVEWRAVEETRLPGPARAKRIKVARARAKLGEAKQTPCDMLIARGECRQVCVVRTGENGRPRSNQGLCLPGASEKSDSPSIAFPATKPSMTVTISCSKASPPQK